MLRLGNDEENVPKEVKEETPGEMLKDFMKNLAVFTIICICLQFLYNETTTYLEFIDVIDSNQAKAVRLLDDDPLLKYIVRFIGPSDAKGFIKVDYRIIKQYGSIANFNAIGDKKRAEEAKIKDNVTVANYSDSADDYNADDYIILSKVPANAKLGVNEFNYKDEITIADNVTITAYDYGFTGGNFRVYFTLKNYNDKPVETGERFLKVMTMDGDIKVLTHTDLSSTIAEPNSNVSGTYYFDTIESDYIDRIMIYSYIDREYMSMIFPE